MTDRLDLRSLAAAVRSSALMALAAVLAAMVVVPAVASAAITRPETGSFTGADSTAGAFSGLGRIAVHQGSGTVYAIDAGAAVVDKFDASGAAQSYSALGSSSLSGDAVTAPDGPVSFSFGGEHDVAVDNSGTASDGHLIVVSEGQGTAWIFDAAGTYLTRLTGFGDVCGAAVDPNGHVWISDYSTATITEFTAAGVATGTSIDTSAQGHVCHADFDATGHLYAAMYAGPVVEYDSAGTFVRVLDSESTTAVTVDRSTGDVYVVHGNKVSVYDDAGTKRYDIADAIPGAFLIGAGINTGTDAAFVSDAAGNAVHRFGPGATLPDVTTGAASGVSGTGATLAGQVDALGIAVTECRFEYGADTSYGASAPCAETVGAGNGAVSVSAGLAGLTPRQTYHYRLVAGNASGDLTGADATFFTATAPQVQSTSVNEVSDTEATLQARLNPSGSATTLHFEYGPDQAYGSSTPESGSIGADNAAHAVTKGLSGLAPGTAYHFRVIARNALGVTTGPDVTFTTDKPARAEAADRCANAAYRTGPAGQLPDCRAYEMVSPVDKNGANIQAPCNTNCQRAELVQSSVDGDKLTYSAAAAFGDQASATYSNQYIASRGPGGWSNHGINAPRDATNHQSYNLGLDLDKAYNAFTSDLSIAWLLNNNKKGLTPDAPDAGETATRNARENTYVRDNATGQYKVIASSTGAPARVVGVSADGRHTVVSDADATTLDDNVDGQSTPVGVLPDGSPAAAPGLGTRFGFPVEDASLIDRGSRAVNHAVSADGSRIFWTDGGGIFLTGNLYVRIDGQRTVTVATPGNFQTASTDGSRVLYDTATGFFDGNADGSLYVFDVDTATRRLVASDLVGVLGASDDLDYIYFDSQAALAPGATAGEQNVYVDHGGEVSLIGVLSMQDVTAQMQSNVSRRPIARTTRVTPDGRGLVFESSRSLTGYDNTDAVTGDPDIEVFAYDAASDRLTCVSCNPSGAQPSGKPRPVPYTAIGDTTPFLRAAAWLPTSETSFYATRPMSDDGKRVFFNSFDALVSRDTNGQQDVYQWEANGSGDCATDGGCVNLISSGQSEAKSEFVDADPRGDNVFFETAAGLVAEDSGLVDIYSARVGGGFAPQPRPATACQGDACQPATPAPSPEKTPATSGPGRPAVASPSRGVVTVKSLTAAQRGQLAAGKPVQLKVSVNGPGRIGVRGVSGAVGHRRTAISAGRTATKAGSFGLKITLSATARKELLRTRKLTVSLSVSFSSARKPVLRTIQLTSAHQTTKRQSTKGGRS